MASCSSNAEAGAHNVTQSPVDCGQLVPNDRCDSGQSWPHAEAIIGGCWLLLGGQSCGTGEPIGSSFTSSDAPSGTQPRTVLPVNTPCKCHLASARSACCVRFLGPGHDPIPDSRAWARASALRRDRPS